MKKNLGWLLLGMLVAPVAQADPYYRVWRGVGRADLTHEQVSEAVRTVLAPMTNRAMEGRGLVGYVPAIPGEQAGIADEVALIVYESEAAYQSVRATPAGKAYGDAHWEMFERSRSSSLVPEPFFGGDLELGKAYSVTASGSFNWRQGVVRVTAAKRAEGVSDEAYLTGIHGFLAGARARLREGALRHVVIGVDGQAVTLFEHFTDAQAIHDADVQGYTRAWGRLRSVVTTPAMREVAIQQASGSSRVNIPEAGAVQLVW